MELLGEGTHLVVNSGSPYMKWVLKRVSNEMENNSWSGNLSSILRLLKQDTKATLIKKGGPIKRFLHSLI